MSEALSIGVVKKPGDLLPRLRETWNWESMWLENGEKKKPKAGLICKGRLQTEGFLTSFSLSTFCKTHSRISVKVPGSVNPMGHGFKMAIPSAREVGKANYSARLISKKK